jgi:hypothetical protein
VLAEALGDSGEARLVRVVRGGLAADGEAIVEAALVPVEAEVPGLLLAEEVELLRLRHLDLRMEAEVVMDAGRAALQPADDDQVGHRRVLATAQGHAPVPLAVGCEPLPGPVAHRLVGGVVC